MSPLHGTYTPWNLLPHSTGIKNLQQTESCDHVFLHIFVLFWHRACKYKMYLIPFKEGKRIRKLAKTFLEIFKDPIEICYFSGCLLFIDTEKFWSCNNKFIVALSQMEFWSFLGTLSLSVDKEIHFQKKPPQCCSHLQENRDELWLPQVFKKKDEKRKKKNLCSNTSWNQPWEMKGFWGCFSPHSTAPPTKAEVKTRAWATYLPKIKIPVYFHLQIILPSISAFVKGDQITPWLH